MMTRSVLELDIQNNQSNIRDLNPRYRKHKAKVIITPLLVWCHRYYKTVYEQVILYEQLASGNICSLLMLCIMFIDFSMLE
jgi:hypothetical protein